MGSKKYPNAYARKRSQLIPEAMKIADKKLLLHKRQGNRAVKKMISHYELTSTGKQYPVYIHWDYWSEFFHTAMEELVREKGIKVDSSKKGKTKIVPVVLDVY